MFEVWARFIPRSAKYHTDKSETSNIYTEENDTIKGIDFIYNCEPGIIGEWNFIYYGEIENGLRHGRGNCNYFNRDIYNGEFQHGKLEGTGVYQYSNGDFMMENGRLR